MWPDVLHIENRNTLFSSHSFPAKATKGKVTDRECDHICKGTLSIYCYFDYGRGGIIKWRNFVYSVMPVFPFPLPPSLFSQVIMLGESGVGKSNLLLCYTHDMFHLATQPTVGTDFYTQIVEVDSKRIKAYIWDTGLYTTSVITLLHLPHQRFLSSCLPILICALIPFSWDSSPLWRYLSVAVKQHILLLCPLLFLSQHHLF